MMAGVNNNTNCVLPKDVLEIVFLLLPRRDRKSAMLVCRSWSQVGEMSKFWTWVCLTVTNENLAVMPQIIGIKRLKAMEDIWVEDWTAVSVDVMKAIEKHPGLKFMDAECSKLSGIEPNLLARVIARLEEVVLDFTNITSQQSNAIFSLAARDCKLKALHMAHVDLSKVDAETLARVVAKLEEAHLACTKLTTEHSEAIVRLASSDCKLKKLNMVLSDISSVDPESLARFVTKLEEVDLSDSRKTPQQCEEIFRFAASDSNLKKLGMSGFAGPGAI